jgi:uncharacterized protein
MNPDDVSKLISSHETIVCHEDRLSGDKIVERDNLLTLYRVFQNLGTDEQDAIAAELTDDVEFEIIGPAMVPFTRKWEGITHVLPAVQQHLADRTQQRDIVNFVVQGNSIVVVSREQSESLQTGEPYDIHWVQIFTFRDGKLCRINEVADGLDLALAYTG